MECTQATEYTFRNPHRTAVLTKKLVRSSFMVALMIIMKIVDMLLSIP